MLAVVLHNTMFTVRSTSACNRNPEDKTVPLLWNEAFIS